MPFPQIIPADTQTGTQVTNSTSWTLTYPTNLAVGDLVIGFVAINADATGGTFPANWVSGPQTTGGANRLYYAKKKSLGTETGTFTVGTFSITCQGAWATFRLTPWDGYLGASWGSFDGAVVIPSSFGSAGTSTAPVFGNPTNPGTWDVDDTLWVGGVSVATGATINAYPSNLPDNNQAVVPGSGTGCTLGVATVGSRVASLTSNAATLSASVLWAGIMIAVRPLSPTVGPLDPAIHSHFGPF